jgi:hypothetical protein
VRYVRAEDDSAEWPAASLLIITLSIVLENELAALAHKKRVQTADPAVLLDLRKALTDLLR